MPVEYLEGKDREKHQVSPMGLAYAIVNLGSSLGSSVVRWICAIMNGWTSTTTEVIQMYVARPKKKNRRLLKCQFNIYYISVNINLWNCRDNSLLLYAQILGMLTKTLNIWTYCDYAFNRNSSAPLSISFSAQRYKVRNRQNYLFILFCCNAINNHSLQVDGHFSDMVKWTSCCFSWEEVDYTTRIRSAKEHFPFLGSSTVPSHTLCNSSSVRSWTDSRPVLEKS